jgi:anaerobic selenocysteine-containing dehydrogenase
MTNLSRRQFLRWASVMGGATLFAGCQFLGEASPVPQYISGAPASDPTESMEGVSTVYSVCGLCAGNCGIACRIAQGMLVKIGGNPFNPVSSGKLISLQEDGKKPIPTVSVCAIGSSGVQTLYDPYRVAKPLKRVGPRGSGKWAAVSWEQAYAEIINGGDIFGESKISGLKGAKLGGNGLGILVGQADLGAESFLKRFANSFGAARLLRDRSAALEDRARSAAQKVFGAVSGAVSPDYANASALISFGDAPLDSGVPLVSTAREITDARFGRNCLKWAVVDPRLSVSASKSDMWVPCLPGRDMALAMGIMRSMVDRYPSIKEIPIADLKTQVSARTVEQRASESGVDASLIHRLADLMIQGGKKSAAIPGRGILSQPQGEDTAAAILTLNLLVGSVPGSGGLIAKNDGFLEAGLVKSEGENRAGRTAEAENPAVMMTWRTDPVYSDPTLADTLRDSKRIPLLVSIDTNITETSSLADYILPDTTYLERFDICSVPTSSAYAGVGIRRPVVGVPDPAGAYFPILTETKIMEDILIGFGAKLGLPGFAPEDKGSSEGLKTAWDFYKSAFTALLEQMRKDGFSVDASNAGLTKLIDRGGYFQDIQPRASAKPQTSPVKYWPGTKATDKQEAPSPDELVLITFEQPFHRSPSSGVNSWLMEVLPENRLLINNSDARKIGIKQGDLVKVENRSLKKTIQLKALVVPGIRPGVAAVARGFGYKQNGASAQVIAGATVLADETRGAGINTAALLGPTGSARVKITKA